MQPLYELFAVTFAVLGSFATALYAADYINYKLDKRKLLSNEEMETAGKLPFIYPY